ncbi:Alpha/Beta hydrolase protein, partial [Epithele typhae]|uniref:Alpha/Beta hydrolase protein n=1 Tax=Epithele typhae TaxID=378194 RepID=UPI002007515B
ESTYTVRDEMVPVEGGSILVRLTTPCVAEEAENFPLFFNIHGGCGCVGTVNTEDYMLRRLTVNFKMVTVNADYRLAPEHPFPTGLNDCLAALKWVVQNVASLKADLEKGFIVGGHSAGAMLSAALAHEARDDPLFRSTPITGQLLREPIVVTPQVVPER